MLKMPFENKVFQISDTLDVDENLQLSKEQEDLIGLIQQKINSRKLSKIERLKSVKEFPSTGTFASISWKVYENLETATLPNYWTLLTTACNNGLANGYFGAAFINSEENHVIVAHRGTEVNNVGAVVADIAGIVFNNYYGGQISSACTFADKIVQALRAVEDKEGVHFEIFFTGHSLGGWLAQVTTFSTAFLNQHGKTFIKIPEGNESYHPQAIVFESPGCLPMLQKLKKKFLIENICRLSITSYLNAPNVINTCNEHFGRVYRIFDDSTKMNFVDRNIAYTLTTHSIERMEKFFQQETHLQASLQEVLEWPTREGLTGTQELEKFLKYANHRNRFHIRNIIHEATEKIRIRYKTRQSERSLYPITIFSEREQDFLELIYWLKHSVESKISKELFQELDSEILTEDILENISSFEIIDQKNISLKNSENLQFFPMIKLLLKLFPRVKEKVQEFLQDRKNGEKVFIFETSRCIRSFKQGALEFKASSMDLERIFSVDNKFIHLKLKQGTPQNGALMIYKLLKSSKFKTSYNLDTVFVLDVKRFCIINKLLNVREFFSSINEAFLVIIYCHGDQMSEGQKKSFESIFDTLRGLQRLKMFYIGDDEFIIEKARHKLNNYFYEIEKSYSWDDLIDDSQTDILKREIKFQEMTSFHILNLIRSDLHSGLPHELHLTDDVFLQLMNDNDLRINSDPLSACDFSVFTAYQDKREIKPKNVLESLECSKDIFVVSGIYDDSVESVLKTLSVIFKDCKREQQKFINVNLVLDDLSCNQLSCKNKKLEVISTIGSKRCLKDFDKKCRLKYLDSKTLHWVKIKKENIYWRKTSTMTNYIERRATIDSRVCSYKVLLDQKLLAVVGKSGDGKSAFITRLAMESIERCWIIVLNFNELTFKNLKIDKLTIESFSSFLKVHAGYETENRLQNFLLQHKLSNETNIKIHFFIDGLDENLKDKDQCRALALLKFISEQTKCRVAFASSGPLANELKATICKLENFNRSERETMLKNTWRTRFSLIWGSKRCDEIFKNEKNSKFMLFAKIILDQLDKTLEQDNTIMGLPKQLKLLAEGFQDDFEKFVQLDNMKPKILDGLKLKTFYQQYINTKYDLYVTAKMRVATMDSKGKKMLNTLQNLSVDSLLPQETRNMFSKNAEFLSPDFVILKLTKGHSPPKILSVFTGYILTDPRCSVLREYIERHEELLPKSAAFDITEEISNSIAGEPMIIACKESRLNILSFLLEILKKKPNLNNFTLVENNEKENALSVAIENCNEACVQKLVKFLIEKGNPENLRIFIQAISKQKLINFLESCENDEFIEWFHGFLLNNEISI